MATVEQEHPAPNQAVSAEASTLAAAFQATAAAYPDEVALRAADGSRELTWAQYAEQVETIARELAGLGVKRGDTVAIMLVNRVEFHLVDVAAIHLGATPFSIYATSSPDQVAYLFENAANDVVITEQAFLEVVNRAREGRERPPHVICIDGDASGDGVLSLGDLEGHRDDSLDFEAAWRAVEPGDVATLIYTSGTTGPPKGVELTHTNILAQCRSVAEVLPMRAGATITSYLPSAHIADRWSSHYNSLVYGLQITSVSDPRAIAQVLPELHPTVWGAVPRVVEKLKAALEAGLAAEPDEAKREGVQKAIAAARQKVALEQAGEPVPEELAAGVAKADEMVLSKLRAKIGLDRAEWIIIGAAPLSREVHEFLLALGLPVTELYGMSECSCCVTLTNPREAKVGTVGQALSCVELSLDEDGELLVKGDTVMRGYRGQPDKTAETIGDDGWLRTGDICQIDDEGFVAIVDRKKELIINAAGKNMSPANIEQELKSADPLIGQAAVIGDGRPYNVALLVLDPDAAASAGDDGVEERVGEAVERANARLSRVEQIKRWTLLPDEWLPGGDELTPTMKLKRKPIAEKHAEAIEALYAD